jgi:hypothetical protein
MRINVDESFLPHFDTKFRETYGAESIFLRAASDLFTNAAVAAMKAKDMPVSEETIASFASKEAEETLLALVRVVDGSVTLFQESCGIVPVGSFSSLVDSTFGEGCFLSWLKEFETEQFDAASKAIGTSE